MKVIDRVSLDSLLDALRGRGYELVGPTIRDGAIVYDLIHDSRDLPAGWRDVQGPGSYRLERRNDSALFGYVVGPHSVKKFLFPPREKLYQVTRNGNALDATPHPVEQRKRALIGVRSCDIHAMLIQDRVFTGGPFVDPRYATRRENLFIVAVNCAEPASTCFCTSMNTGPAATTGFDLALTELIYEGKHEFTIEVGSPAGEELLRDVSHRDAARLDESRRRETIDRAAAAIRRRLETAELKELLYRNVNHSRWDDVASRCLTCANCTLVCPTCFCSTVEDVTDLSGDHAERWRLWDSCFTMDFSYLVGGSLRASARARYRQWMTHKLASWQDQFGVIGCVGCGRCITWCPVGIDITEEAAAIRAADIAGPSHSESEKQHVPA